MKIGREILHSEERKELRKSLATLVEYLNSNVALSDAERKARRMKATSELSYANIPYGYDVAFDWFWFPGVGKVDLYGDERKALWDLIHLIREYFPDTFSWDYIYNVITGPDSLIERLVASRGLKEEAIDRELDILLDHLVSSIDEWVVSVPIVNLKIEVWPIFHEGGDEWCLPIGKVKIYAIKDMPEFNPEWLVEWQRESLESAQYAARTKVKAGDPQQAIKKAIIETQNALNIIRLFLSSAIRTDHYAFYSKMNIVGRGKKGIQLIAARRVASPEDDPLSYNHSWRVLGVEPETFIHEAAFQYMKDNGFEEINQIFSAENPNSLQQQIVRAISWFAEGTNSDNRVDGFIKYVIALEVLLGREGKKDDEGKRSRIAERAAFLLQAVFKWDRRQQIVKNLKRLYDKRSALVHGSSFQVGMEELSQLELYARHIIFAFARKQKGYNTFQDFLGWIDRQRFAVNGAGAEAK